MRQRHRGVASGSNSDRVVAAMEVLEIGTDQRELA